MFDKVSASWGIYDGHTVLAGLESPQGEVNGDTTLAFNFQLIQDPGTLEGALAQFSSLPLKFSEGSFVDLTTFVDRMASSGGLAGIYTSSDHSVAVNLLLSLSGFDRVVLFVTPVFWWQTHCQKPVSSSFTNQSPNLVRAPSVCLRPSQGCCERL